MNKTLLAAAVAVPLLVGPAWGDDAERPAESAKEPPPDTRFLRDYAETRGFMLGRPTKAKPTPDGKAVLYLRAQPRSPLLRLYEFDVAAGKSRELLTPEAVLKGAQEKLSPAEKALRERMRVSVGGFTDFQVSDDGGKILVSLSGKPYVFHRKGGKVQELKVGTGTILDAKFSPDGRRVSYVRDYDVYAYDLAADAEKRLTFDGTERVSHGLAEFVAQEEMSRFSGYWWSPDSSAIIYEEADARNVEVWYVADPAQPGQAPLTSFYPRPGKDNVSVRLVIVSVVDGNTVTVTWDHKRYPYLARVHWDRSGPLTLTVQSRDQKELVLLKVDPEAGVTTPLVTERDATWVNIAPDVPRWLSDGKRFLWVSERDGGPQLELRNDDRKLGWVLVPPEAGYQGLVDLDARSGEVVYRAGPDPTQSHLYRVSLESLEPVKMTRTPGLHQAVYARDRSVFVHTVSALDAMPRTTVHKADGSLAGELDSVAEAPPFEPKLEIVKVGGERSFYAAVVKPRKFSPRKRYPVIVDVYGGPLHNKVVSAMSSRLLDQWLADQGFIVVSVDGRGTPGRGRAWERALYKQFGTVPLEDQVAGLEALARQVPEMDLRRVGIVGWSYGGYLSALAVLKRPDVFKAAVAGAPVVDWLDYDTHYTERYLGLPDVTNPAYQQASLLTYAAELDRPLLLLHGTADDNVYFRHSLRLVNALFRAGKDFEILPLSGLTHMVPDPVVTERLWTRVLRHFQKHLGRPKESSAATAEDTERR